jgi:pSer/pThr/pTyr-binding forkhead associated (FHA) protein
MPPLATFAFVMASIQFTTPSGSSGLLDLTAERMSLGRADDNQLIISDDSVSSHHGEVSFDGSAWILTDFGSTNGTKINGERVEALQLGDGGSFTLGNVECVFIGDGQASGSPRVATSHAVSSDSFAARPYDRSFRTGFVPKKTVNSPGSGGLIALGILALLACGVAAYFASQLG